MRFVRHPELEGRHAILSASKGSWIRYDDDKIIERIKAQMSASLGTDLHNLAAEAIRLKRRFPDTQDTLNMYVNDAIDLKMTPEQPLIASPYAFGTADAISFRVEKPDEKPILRIHDLKNGVHRVTMDQLLIYSAFFCLEYHVKPHEIDIELRIYQNNYQMVYIPDPEDVLHIMDHTVFASQLIEKTKMEAEDE